MAKKFSGLWPAMVTPLNAAGRVSEATIERLVELFVEQGLDGLYVTGSTGQWPLLNVAERKSIAERVVRTAGGRLEIMIHVGAVATDDAIELARHAAEIGADAVSSVAPLYYSATNEVVFEHFRQIGAASRLPLFVYHLEGVTPTSVEAREYVERLLSVPNIAGMKLTSRDLYQFGLIHSLGGDRLRLFSGADELMCHAALSGATGAIGTFYNIWGPACQASRQAFVAGDVEAGRRFMLALQDVIAEVLGSRSIWSFIQAALIYKYDIDIGRPRAPWAILDKSWGPQDVERLNARIEEARPSAHVTKPEVRAD